MQRSLSNPIGIPNGLPVSPTAAHNNSRSPTPSSEHHDDAQKPKLYESYESRSSSRASDVLPGQISAQPLAQPDSLSNKPQLQPPPQTLALRLSDDLGRRRHHHHHHPSRRQSPMASRKSVVPQANLPTAGVSRHVPGFRPLTPSNMASETSATTSMTTSMTATASSTTATKYHKKPLIQDASLYTNSHLVRDSDNTNLEELAHIVRLSKYQERKRASTRIRLQRSLISTALSARLTRCGEMAHRYLVENFRKDDKDSFAALYNAIHDVRKSCDELRRYALLEPELEALNSAALGSSDSLDTPTNSTIGIGPLRSITPFLHDVSATSREAFLDFLTQIRTNPDYLATRICSLTSSELKEFLSFHKGLEPVESVLPFHARPPPRPHASASGRFANNSDIDRLLSFQRHDPLSILIHACFANSAGPDSSEDQRRTEIWATVLAQLIAEPKSTGEHFLICVLNIWTAMRDWSGKIKMEWYLMKILEDGAFLLDRAEDQHGTRFNVSDWDRLDEIAAKEFYEKAVNGLFELVDDDDATGIPEGLLELGNAILSKLEDKYVENTSKWLVWRCLFFVFLVSVIIHPEYYGMLADYHITPYAREKILKKVAMKAHEFVSSMWSGNPSATCVPVNIPPKIKGHVENILLRFQGSHSKIPAAKLLPARSITSLRETVEVRPYLVISPADLLTLVNALFPEKRMTAGMRSGPASISISMAGQGNSHRSFDTASIISTTAGSIFSEAINTREYYDPISPQRDSPPANDPDDPPPPPKDFEDDGIRLRLALHELKQNLGPDVLRGTCHPCAERWVVLFISPDGKGLSTTMTYDPDDELEDEDNSSSTDTDDDDGVQRPELDKDYHLLRNSILKLVEEYEIPRSLEPARGRAQLSNKASGLNKYGGSRNRIVSPEKTIASRNPYRKQMHAAESASPTLDTVLKASKAAEEFEPVLITMLKAASAQSKAQSDFVSAHMYWKTLNQLTALASSSLRQDGFAALINILARGPRDAFRRSASAIEDYDAWLVWLKQSQERHEGLIDDMMKRVDAIRNKMWYVTDVRNSKEYVHSRDICQALKTMAMPRRWSSFQRNRASNARGASSSFLYRTESQIMDLLAASEDQGGPNKLSDDQAEVTLLWLRQSAIENFCQGEERIHRFCCEVDRCTSKLVGENIREAPVLWSSELFKRDKIIHERARRDRDHSSWAGDDTTSIISSEQERRQTSSSGRSSSFARDLRSMATSTTSQHSFDYARHGHRAGGTLSDIPDGQEYFDKASPGHLDPGGTFWSPFSVPMSPSSAPSRAYSPTTSVTNVSTTFSGPTLHNTIPSTTSASTGRPGTSASSNETVQQQRGDDEKTKFLSELKQTLTSLLLSDLGNQVLARGSETDNWFKKYGQQCIDRKDSLERRARRKAEKKAQKASSGRQRVIEKKDSFGNLRGMGGPEPSLSSMGAAAAAGSMDPSSGAAAVDAPSKSDSGEFPFKKAYQRLLNMFCVHPDPYAKLSALNELEQLIIASMLSNGSKRTRWNRSDAGSSVVEDHQPGTRSVPLEGTIDNVKERRLHAIQGSLPPTGFNFQSRNSNSETRSIVSGSGGYGDAITKELLNLFRDASIRPKSLFRDLQFIAAFVPPSVLDKPEKGKAFWDAGLAALELKSEVCRTMVEMADEALEAHTAARQASSDNNSSSNNNNNNNNTAGPDPSQSAANSSSTPPSTIYDMEDIGRMWTIAAKEGLPTAQRELALFYLANPECVERTTLPLSKPREVFKQTVMEKYGRSDRAKLSVSGPSGSSLSVGVGSRGAAGAAGGAGAGDGPLLAGHDGDVRTDPGLMCVAVHWMEAAKKGDDELASSFLRQNEFMGLS